jgi:hypothetical protein
MDSQRTLLRSLLGIVAAASFCAVVLTIGGEIVSQVSYGDAYPVEDSIQSLMIAFVSLLVIGAIVFSPMHWVLKRIWPSAIAYGLAGSLLGCGLALVIALSFRGYIEAAMRAGASPLEVWHPVIEIGSLFALTMGAFGLVFWSVRRPDRDRARSANMAAN